MQQRHKQRILGAVVIIALAVIFLPMLLRGPVERSGLEVPMEIPPRPVAPISGQSVSRQVAETQPAMDGIPIRTSGSEPADQERPSSRPLQTPITVEEPANAAAPRESAAVEREAEPQAEPGAEPAAETASAQRPDSRAESPAPVSSELSSFAVQVGSFRSRDNAFGLRNRLREQGFSAFVEEFSGSDSTVYRLRVGPVMERSEAETLMHRLKQDADLDGLVLSHP